MARKTPDNPQPAEAPEIPEEAGAVARDNFIARSRTADYSSDADLKERLPDDILTSYECHQWKHAAAILATDFPQELKDIVHVLRTVKLRKSFMTDRGGGKSPYAKAVDKAFRERGWAPKRWSTAIVVDDTQMAGPTHEVDCFKNRIGLELEWSNKDPFYDRDLNNFRLLFDLRVISVGIIITKADELAGLLSDLGVWGKYGATTTWSTVACRLMLSRGWRCSHSNLKGAAVPGCSEEFYQSKGAEPLKLLTDFGSRKSVPRKARCD